MTLLLHLRWLLLFLLGSSAAASLLTLRCSGTRFLNTVGVSSVAIDVLVLTGMVAAFEFETNGTTWAVMFILPTLVHRGG